MGEFLAERDFIGWAAPEGFPASLDPAGLFTQDAPHGLEVALAESPRKPTAPDLRRAWAKRRAGRVSPVLVVARYPTAEGERVSLCGPAGDPPIVQHGVEVSQAERLAGVALDEPNRHAATRFLLAHLPELDQPMPGLRNVGLLSTQELEAGVPQRSDWPEAGRRARPLLGLRGRPLAERLGFGVSPLSTNTSMLTIGGHNRAIAVFCDEDEPFDAPAQRFEGAGPVDFRSLSVREFGTIYEGLLESRLSVAQSDLTVKKAKGQAEYVPASGSDPVEVEAGAVYVHNRSGARKATGSYFTKPFAVTHLLNHALAPALDNHIARLEELKRADDDAALADAFFDFRCADIAMGSGHFLVAALDRIEARLSGWLALNPVPAVTAELQRLRKTAVEALGDLAAGVEVETSSLLRRQVARHCIYGVDRNQVAVELARLAVWVHTFVPGLPLSFLDHNLVCGDSLTGVGNLDEAAAAFEPEAEPEAPSLYRSQLEELLAAAESALRRLARTSDATKREIDEARTAHQDAQRAVAGARALFDLITADRAGACSLPEHFDESVFIREAAQPGVAAAVESLAPLHFPAAFPEVFLRDRPGFDCLLGNPPWEKVKVEKKIWWGMHIPGVRSWNEKKMNDAIEELQVSRPDLETLYQGDILRNDQMRAVLLAGPYPGIGRSDPDLFMAFAWRNWHLARPGIGHVGVVLPRTAFAGSGMAAWRQDMLQRASLHLTTLRNKGHWVFDDVHQQYQVVLAGVHHSLDADRVLDLLGPFHDIVQYTKGMALSPNSISVDEFNTWTSNASVPMLPSDHALRVFRKMRLHPRFDGSTTEVGPPSRLDKLIPSNSEQFRAIPSNSEQFRAIPSNTEPGFVCCRSSTRRATSICSAVGSTPMAVPSHPGLRRQLGQAPLRPRRRGGGDEAQQRLLAGVHGQVVQPVEPRHRGVLVVG